jgi:hypothetical protein
VLTNFVNLETISVCLYLQNNAHLLFVSCYNPPDFPILHTEHDSVFSSFEPVLLFGDLNCEHTTWNCISVDGNGRTLLSHCLKTLQLTTLITPRTFVSTSSLVYLILLSQSTVYCPNHCLSPHSPLTITPWRGKILLRPSVSEPLRFSIICLLTGLFSVPH